MKIVDIRAYAIRAPNPVDQIYWGSKTWAAKTDSQLAAAALGPRSFSDDNYPPHWRMQAIYSETIDTTIVRLTTDNGLVGYGEAKAPVAPEVCREIIHQLLRPVVLGADPFDMNVLWERMYAQMRLRGHTTGFYLEALSGVDIALWDVAGKAAGLPVHKLMGGSFRERVKVYASGLPGLKDGSDMQAASHLQRSAATLVERGFQAIKLGIGFGIDADLKTVEAIRSEVGPDVLLLTDAGGNYDVAQAIRVGHGLEAMGVGWLEAPLPPEHVDGYSEVARALALPVASDLIVGRYVAQNYLSKHALDVIQPDVCRAGGISECKRIADLADAYGIAFAPHVSIGSAIQFAATAHLAAAVPNLMIGEYWVGQNPIGDAILQEPLMREGSHLIVPQKPGLGLEIDEDALMRYAVQ